MRAMPAHIRTPLSAARARDLLVYSPETGEFTWRVKRNGTRPGGKAGGHRPGGYVGIRIDYQMYAAHRLAWFYVYGEWPQHSIDHINGNPSDNRIANLRDVPHVVNMQNQRRALSTSKTGLLGTHQVGDMFCAEIVVHGRVKYLGTFWTAELAHAVYLRAKRKLHEGCTI